MGLEASSFPVEVPIIGVRLDRNLLSLWYGCGERESLGLWLGSSFSLPSALGDVGIELAAFVGISSLPTFNLKLYIGLGYLCIVLASLSNPKRERYDLASSDTKMLRACEAPKRQLSVALQ